MRILVWIPDYKYNLLKYMLNMHSLFRFQSRLSLFFQCFDISSAGGKLHYITKWLYGFEPSFKKKSIRAQFTVTNLSSLFLIKINSPKRYKHTTELLNTSTFLLSSFIAFYFGGWLADLFVNMHPSSNF